MNKEKIMEIVDTTIRRIIMETKDDPYLLGHFSDNELPMPSLEKHLELDQNNPDLKYGYLAAREWLTQRRGGEAGIEDINDLKADMDQALDMV